jgi:hypothetical protein
MHSEDDQTAPYVASGRLSAKPLKTATLKPYKDFPHGMPTTHAETINTDLLALIRSWHASGGKAQRTPRLPTSQVAAPVPAGRGMLWSREDGGMRCISP